MLHLIVSKILVLTIALLAFSFETTAMGIFLIKTDTVTVPQTEPRDSSVVDSKARYSVKVKDPHSGKKYWLHHLSHQDITKLKMEKYTILKTKDKDPKFQIWILDIVRFCLEAIIGRAPFRF